MMEHHGSEWRGRLVYLTAWPQMPALQVASVILFQKIILWL